MKYPKVLVVANNCFSLSNSNGRTLGNFFEGWPKECLAEFCLGIVDPNLSLCENYFCVTDNDALRAFTFRGNKGAGLIKGENDKSNRPSRPKRAWNMLIRHLVWNSGRWKKCGFDAWVDGFGPDVILFQNGDSAFMSEIALDISKRKGVPLMIFNTEGYYFFKKNYMGHHWSDFLCFPFYQWLYRRQYRKMMKSTVLSIYCNSLLQEDYDREFSTQSPVLYTNSGMQFKPKPFNAEKPRFSYLGSLGLDRPYALIDIANALHYINKDYVLDIYGKLPLSREKVFDNCKSVRFRGRIDYPSVVDVIRRSDVVFHAETQEGPFLNSLKYGFSTKIADSVSSGTNFLLYAPSFLACSKYVMDSNAAWYVSKHEDLVPTLSDLISNKQKREQILDSAKELADKNHNAKVNCAKFKDLVLSVVNKQN